MNFAEMLHLEPDGPASWIGAPGLGVGKRMFGGHALAQALMAACLAEPGDKLPHSLHAGFLAPGGADEPTTYRVSTLSEGRSFSKRRVDAFQGDRHILTMTVSAQVEETGFTHALPPPDAVDVETALQQLEVWKGAQEQFDKLPVIGRLSKRPVEAVPLDVEGQFGSTAREAASACWMRSPMGETGDAAFARCQLAYASDMLFLRNALLPHGVRPGEKGIQIASLDHAIWFHGTPDFTRWNLYSGHSPWAGGARGLSLGHFFAEDGALIATVAQENLMRLLDDRLEGC